MAKIRRHKVFISFHKDDARYRDQLVRRLKGDIIDRSVHEEDIDDDPLKTETVRQKIRDEFIADATVTVVLVGPCTWRRKFVDWEIGSSLRETKKNPRCGLVGLLLPNHPDFQRQTYQPNLVPPRLYDNARPEIGFARIWRWSPLDPADPVLHAIDWAHGHRYAVNPDNSREQFARNRSSACALGWRDG